MSRPLLTWHRHVAAMLTVATCVSIIGCNDSPTSSSEPTPVSALYASFVANESDPRGPVMVIGDTLTVEIDAITTSGCWDSPCTAHVNAVVRASTAGVLTPTQRTVRTPGSTSFIATGLGSVVLSVTAETLVRSTQVRVIAAPLPVDSISIRSGWSAFDLANAFEHDRFGNLVSMTLPTRGYAALSIGVYRAGDAVSLPMSIASSDSSVVAASLSCRAKAVDPTCDNLGKWITGLSAGTATVTVTARNLQRSFQVIVQ